MKKPCIINIKNIIWAFLALFLLILIILFPKSSISYASDALNIFLSNVFPCIFPFMIANSIFIKTNALNVIGSILSPAGKFFFNCPGESVFCFLIGALSGYPIGSKMTCELYAKGKLSKPEAIITLCMSSVTSPLFISATVCLSIFNIPQAALYICTSHYIGALISAFIISFTNKKRRIMPFDYLNEIKHGFKSFISTPINETAGEMLKESILNAIKSCCIIGGFIIIFSVFCNLITKNTSITAHISSFINAKSDVFDAIFTGIIEMTSGLISLSSIEDINAKISIASFIISFGGLSIFAQSAVFIPKELNLKAFFLLKILHGIFAFLIAFVLLNIFPITIKTGGFPPALNVASSVFPYVGMIYAFLSISLLYSR